MLSVKSTTKTTLTFVSSRVRAIVIINPSVEVLGLRMIGRNVNIKDMSRAIQRKSVFTFSCGKLKLNIDLQNIYVPFMVSSP